MYTVSGSVRGILGENLTAHEAVALMIHDREGCASQGGYSDCEYSRTDGESMSEEDWYTLQELECHERADLLDPARQEEDRRRCAVCGGSRLDPEGARESYLDNLQHLADRAHRDWLEGH